MKRAGDPPGRPYQSLRFLQCEDSQLIELREPDRSLRRAGVYVLALSLTQPNTTLTTYCLIPSAHKLSEPTGASRAKTVRQPTRHGH